MFDKALLATDLSPASDRVVEYMRSLRPIGCKEVVLTYVVYVKHTVGLSDMLRDEASPKLDAQKRALEAEGLAVSVETPTGVPGPTITRLALERGCSLVVIGSHGHSAAREVALGGVATDVVHRSEVPVLAVRLRILEGEGEPVRLVVSDILGHVLHPTDFSDNAERAFRYVESLVQSGCKQVTLLHVQEVTRISPHLDYRLEEFNAIDRGRLDRLKGRLIGLGAEHVGTEVVYGKPAQKILDRAESMCPSVIIMGTHGRGFVTDMLIGSVSHNVVRHAPAPVLLVPGVR